MTFREWTVLPHDPIERLANNLWSVSGTMPKGNQRRMTVARLGDGRLIVHNAIALGAQEMEQLDAWGNVSAIVVPNAFHRQDAYIWSQRYPEAKVYAPNSAVGKVRSVVEVHGDYDDLETDDTVRAEHVAGMGKREGVILVRSSDGTTAVFNDAILNMERTGGLKELFLAPTGRPSVPRFTRWMMVKDKQAFVEHLRTIADAGVRRVIVGHGATVETDAASVLTSVANEV